VIVPASADLRSDFADGVWDDSPPQGVEMIAAPSAASEVEVIVVVAKTQPAELRTTPPLLVAEVSLVRKRLTPERLVSRPLSFDPTSQT
jgi:hypothetical protein